jgi:hypothetical protein
MEPTEDTRRIVPLDEFLYLDKEEAYCLDLPRLTFNEAALLIIAAKAIRAGMTQVRDVNHRAVILKLNEFPDRLFARCNPAEMGALLMEGRLLHNERMAMDVMPLFEHMRILVGHSGVLPAVALTCRNSVAGILGKLVARAGILTFVDMCVPIMDEESPVLLADVLALYAGTIHYPDRGDSGEEGGDLGGSNAQANLVLGWEMLECMLGKMDGLEMTSESLERRLESAMAYIAATDGVRSEVSVYIRGGKFEKAVFMDITW